MNYETLKTRQRSIRDDFPMALGLRVHRALSWLARSEQEETDTDARFIFLWIAFNAAYANDLPDRKQFKEKGVFANFIKRLITLDSENLLGDIVWTEFPNSIRLIINNQYVFQPFWDHQNGLNERVEWQRQFSDSKAAANRALGNHNTVRVLLVVLDRLYTLRNQLLHGGATWNGSVNRSQVRDAAQIMSKIVPVLIHIMMENAREVWGEPCYPVVK